MTFVRRSRAALGAVLATAILGLAACGGSDPVAVEPPDEVEITIAAVSLGLSVPPNNTDSGSREAACPVEGRMLLNGPNTLVTTADSMVHRWNQTVQFEDCAFEYQGLDILTTGNVSLIGEAHYGPQGLDLRRLLLSGESVQTGTVTTTSDGETRTCGYNLSITVDSTTYEQLITGTVCHESIDLKAPPAFG